VRGGHAAGLADRLGQGIRNPYNLRSSSSRPAFPVPRRGHRPRSDAALAMELGCDGVLLASSIFRAADPVAMAGAMRKAVEAGFEARGAGRISAPAPRNALHTRRRAREPRLILAIDQGTTGTTASSRRRASGARAGLPRGAAALSTAGLGGARRGGDLDGRSEAAVHEAFEPPERLPWTRSESPTSGRRRCSGRGGRGSRRARDRVAGPADGRALPRASG
jgi:hypothetical protein